MRLNWVLILSMIYLFFLSAHSETSKEKDNIDKSVQIITLAVGLGGLWFGLLQYREAQKWKKMEFAAALINRINDDQDIRLAVTFLDWRQREIILPETYSNLNNVKKTFLHSHKKLFEAFDMNNRERIDNIDNVELKEQMLNVENNIYIDTFDRFFEYLEQINQFIEIRLIRIHDVESIKYWAIRICTMRYNDHLVFEEYLKHYKYEGVLKLGKMCQ